MAVADRVQDTSSTTGTGNFTLSGTPPTGRVSFNTAYGLNARFEYTIDNGAEWECGIGYLSASTTLVREVVTSSSNSGALVSFTGASSVYTDVNAKYFSGRWRRPMASRLPWL